MLKNRKLIVGLYVLVGILTFAYQTVVRIPSCTGSTQCSFSIAKGTVRSVAWPVSWGLDAYNWLDADADSDTNRNAAVDSEWYLAQYPDVRAAVQSGKIKSAEEHYRSNGYLEKRFPSKPKVDEQYYLRANPDVAAAVKKGQFESGYQHYFNNGYREGRKPSP